MSTANPNPTSLPTPDGSNKVLIQQTPIGLTADQMRASNAAEVAKLEQTAAAKAVADDRQRLTALKAAFPNDAAFAMEAYEKGLSVDGAKAQRHDVLAESNAKLSAELAELKKKSDTAPAVKFNVSDKGTAEGQRPNATDTSVDAGDSQAKALWENSAELRAEFGDEFKTFAADFKRNPQEYAKG